MNNHSSCNDNRYRCGSFPGVRAVTGRRPRGFSLHMKISEFKAFPFFFCVTHCLLIGWDMRRKEARS
ncbi:hypothetical protein YA19_06990 [Klebsiella aerogenes]|nr:hypothetical protein YA19_06990 [Klebsiella aerogenes]